jgi:DNA ligase 1
MTSIPFFGKPMLAGKATDDQIEKLFDKGPMLASPKLDGIRCMVQNGIALSRSLKKIRNTYVQTILGAPEFSGLDGELIVGNPTDSDVYRNTTSNIMREKGEPKFTFWVFDYFLKNDIYKNRIKELSIFSKHMPKTIKILGSQTIINMEELREYEMDCLSIGYEGVILRDPNSMYKHGRSTAKEGGLIKVNE